MNVAAEERAEVLTALRDSCTRFLHALDSIPPALQQQSAAEGRWSVLQCLEHVVNAEEGMLKLWRIMGHRGSTERDRDEWVRAAASDRSNKRQAPERVVPQGRIKSVAEGRERFVAARAATMAFVEKMRDEDLRGKVVPHPMAGTADGYQLFNIMALHAERHAEQIIETANQLTALSRGEA